MPRLALALVIVSFVSLFLVRSVIQWSQTGSTGFKGFHGGVGSLPWLAGAATTLGLVLTSIAPVSTLLGWPGGALFATADRLHWTGAWMALAGVTGALAAQLTMGRSWRIGVDEAETTELVTSGLFARVRNPIFTFMCLTALGTAMLVPNAWASAGVLLSVLGIELQVRFVEEPHLRRVHGAEYARYAALAGRFVPGIGRIRARAAG